MKREWLDGVPAGRWRAQSDPGLHEWGGLPLALPSSAAHTTKNQMHAASSQPMLTLAKCKSVASD